MQGRERVSADEIIKTGVEIDDSVIPVLYTGWTDRAWDTDEFWGNSIFLDTTAAEYIVEKGTAKRLLSIAFPKRPSAWGTVTNSGKASVTKRRFLYR